MNNFEITMPCEESSTSTLQCGHCKNNVNADRVGSYQGCDICDDCAETLTPARYAAGQEQIVDAANEHCKAEIGGNASIARLIEDGIIPLIEDEFGDVLDCGSNKSEPFTRPVVFGESMVDFLPEEVRLMHRRAHRQAIRQSTPKEYWFAAGDERWTAELHPFTAGNEMFTLSLFSKAA
jgi:hypothetical protein